MRWVVAIVGGLLVFVGVFLITSLGLAILWPAALSYEVGVGDLYTNNPTGAVLAALAATQSFRASLRRGRRGKKRGDKVE